MAASLDDLEKDLARALDLGDPERIIAVRGTIGASYADTEAGAEANYRLAVSALFSGQDIDMAVERLRAAIKAKSKRWTPQARTSLGILMYRQGKTQQAIFELRKVAGARPPTLASAQALGFIVMIQREVGKDDDAKRTRGEQLKALNKLVGDSDVGVAALVQLMLGMEKLHDGDRAGAKALLERALASGQLDDDERRTAKRALTET